MNNLVKEIREFILLIKNYITYKYYDLIINQKAFKNLL